MIAPNRHGRSQTQDRMRLDSYPHRWKIERLFTWFQYFRRLVVRYQYHTESFLAFVHLGCLIMLLRRHL